MLLLFSPPARTVCLVIKHCFGIDLGCQRTMKKALPQVPAVFNPRSGTIERQALAMPATAVLARTAPTPMPAVFRSLPLVVQKVQASQSIVQLQQAHRSAVAVATAAMRPSGPAPGQPVFAAPAWPAAIRARRPDVLQAKINFDSHYRGLKASDSKDLIAKLVREFGEANRQRIVADIAEISRSRATWSLMQIRLHFRKLAEQGTIAVHATAVPASLGRAPIPDSLRSFTLLNATQLVARVADRIFAQRSHATLGHAERRLMRELDSASENVHDAFDLKTNPRIGITINNSPCEACAAALAVWAAARGLTNVHIYFTSPYGSVEEFKRSIGVLQAAGIKVHGLDLSARSSDPDLTERGRKALMKLGGKLRKTRESKEYVSDDEADGKESKSQKKPASGKGAPGGASRKRKEMLNAGSGGGGTSTSQLPSSKTVGGKRPRTLAAPAVIPGAGTVVDVSPAGMNCLIRALMRSTGHLNPEPSVAALRAHLIGAGFAITGAMLDAAGGAGMLLFTEMQRQLLIAAGRGLIVYSYNIDGAIIAHTIVPGGNPVRIWFSDSHFQAII